MDDVTLLDLPDDALAAVLAFVPPRQLFSCRLVCRRLRDVCLHPDVWRTVRLQLRGTGLLRAALRLAPRLREIGPNVTDLASLAALVPHSPCVIDKVGLHVRGQNDVAPAIAVLFALPELKQLDLVFWQVPPGCTRKVLTKVFHMDELLELYIWIMFKAPRTAGPLTVPKRSTLTRLTYGSPFFDPFLKVLLLAHRKTLEHVRLHKMDHFPAYLLNDLPRLRSLTCPWSADLSEMHTLPNLKAIELEHSGIGAPLPGRAMDFVARAAELRSVKLSLLSERMWPRSVLAILGSSPSARVMETLSLGSPVLEQVASSALPAFAFPSLLEQVARALPSFPSLRTLALDTVPSETFLEALSPASAPSLAMLEMRRSQAVCPHDWLHLPSVQKALARNPRLHLRLVGTRVVAEKCRCAWCQVGCHAELKSGVSLESAFSSHTRQAGCPSDCFQVVGPLEPSLGHFVQN